MKRTNKILFLLEIFLIVFMSIGCNAVNDFIELNNWFESSGILNNVIVVNYKDDAVFCKFSCQNGKLATSDYAQPIRTVETKVNQNVSWVSVSENSLEKIQEDYITILLLKDSNVVGYAVLEILLKEDKINYQATILEQRLLKIPLAESKAVELTSKIINNNGDSY